MPPIEGLQDICPSVSMLCVINNVLQPIRELASAASVPAWPPPTTITSNLPCEIMILNCFGIRCADPQRRTEEFYVINGCDDSSFGFTWNIREYRRLDGKSVASELALLPILLVNVSPQAGHLKLSTVSSSDELGLRVILWPFAIK